MINGMHVVIYSRDAEADRDFIRDVLGFPSVDAGGGWLIFAAPPSGLACHPAEHNDKHEVYLMCDNVEMEVERLKQSRIKCGPISREQWGLLTTIKLPGGGRLGLYEPRHPRPHGSLHGAGGQPAAPVPTSAPSNRSRARGTRRS